MAVLPRRALPPREGLKSTPLTDYAWWVLPLGTGQTQGHMSSPLSSSTRRRNECCTTYGMLASERVNFSASTVATSGLPLSTAQWSTTHYWGSGMSSSSNGCSVMPSGSVMATRPQSRKSWQPTPSKPSKTAGREDVTNFWIRWPGTQGFVRTGFQQGTRSAGT